ncbi:hypothetical protein [Parabacteroides johnsonii]|uniref:hypothetical protein n=1 Tax=Parabacteroides johnsonii TaxID=387661 RepID=UPI002430AD26|nr:hypothetical protein [Parabacteroides johnsonii]
MKQERKVIAYKHYFADFMSSLSRGEASKIGYVLDMLKTQERISAKFVTQKTPESEINKALKIKKEYYETKGNQ